MPGGGGEEGGGEEGGGEEGGEKEESVPAPPNADA
jgi:hypothetical protein